MILPELPIPNQTRDMIQTFGGYNHNIRIADNEFYDMQNLSSTGFPTLSPRQKRGEVKEFKSGCRGILAKDKLCYVDGNTLYYGDFDMPLDSNIDDERQLVSMGAYVIVFPDQMYLNTADTSDRGRINGDPQTFTSDTPTFTLVDVDLNSIAAESLIIDSGKGNNASVLKDSEYFVASKKQDTIYVNPLDMTGKKMYLDGIIAGSVEIITDQIDFDTGGTQITYQGGHDPQAYSFHDNKLVIRAGRDDHGYYLQTTWNDPKYWDQNKVELSWEAYKAGLDSASAPVFGTFTCTRTIGEYVETRTWRISAKKDTNYAFEWNPIKEGSLRLYEKEKAVFEVQKCIKIRDDAVTTWRDSKCWVTVPTKVIITYKGTTIGTEAEKIAGNNSSDTVKITCMSERKPYWLQSLLKEYADDSVKLLKNVATSHDIEQIEINGCLNFITSTAGVDIETPKDIVISFNPLKKELDYVTECGNRLWGCRYGLNNEGKFVNEIYATQLGSFRNWDVLDNTSEDSYAVSLGTDGAFTGAVTYKDKPIFFKENCMHTIYGSYPASYQLQTDSGTGVQQGSYKSLCINQGVLYYKAKDGVYRYDGATYDKLSEPLGDVEYSDASAGCIDNKLYMAMTSVYGVREMFVYDISKGMWHKEDAVNANHFARYKGDLYFCNDSTRTLMTVKGSVGTKESGDIRWFAETGDIGYSTPDAKYLDKIQLRITLPHGSIVRFYVEYDSDGFFEYIGNISGKSEQAFTLPLFPRRCDHFRLKLEGVGACKIHTLSKVMEDGGEW